MNLSRIFLAPLWILCSLWRLWQRFSHATYVSAAHNVRSLPGTMIYLIRGALCSKLEPLKCNHGNDLWNLLAYIVIITIIIIFPSASFKLAHIVSFIDSNLVKLSYMGTSGGQFSRPLGLSNKLYYLMVMIYETCLRTSSLLSSLLFSPLLLSN